LVCLLPLLILLILYKNKSLERVIVNLQAQNKYYYTKLRKNEKDRENDEINIISDNKSDKLSLKYRHIVSVKSANNYTEINYIKNNELVKKLIRNTLKNIESQLTNKSIFIRCHRTSIVNINYIDKLFRSYNGYRLTLTCCDEHIPVARQYVILIKEALSIHK
jgi:DNA-binding LytR/AlgR family response regulator